MQDDSFIMSKRGLIRSKDGKVQTPKKITFGNTSMDAEYDLSITLANHEIKRLLDNTTLFGGNVDDTRQMMDTYFERLDKTTSDSMTMIRPKSEHLYSQFLEVLQSRTNDSELFETIQDLIQTCTDVYDEIITQGKRVYDKNLSDEHQWLRHERNSWRLIYCLYKDRLIVQKDAMDCDDLPLGGSEKTIVEHLYLTNSNLREYQLIVDWLEMCALEQSSPQVGFFTDRTVAWENTLHQLQNIGQSFFGSGRDIVKSLDPDAPFREKRPLHDLDVEDAKRLLKEMFLRIRQGRIQDAQSLCEHCGQPWQAAILEGWRLHHDPNYENNNTLEKLPIEGNPRRDIWKKCAWMKADSRQLDEYTRAIAGVFCGHLESLLTLGGSWMDLLWAYLKVQIDIRVESEIRSCNVKNNIPMPEQYWKNKMSLEQIFEELVANRNSNVQIEAGNTMNVIIKYVILDDIPELMRQVDSWVADSKISPQMLRFLTHIILFMRQIGRPHQEDIADKVIKSYVESLFEMRDPQLVAFYTAALPREMQIYLYSQFLEFISDSSSRKQCLEEAVKAGLDIDAITCFTVSTIRNREREEFDQVKQLKGHINEFDQNKISALEWLAFYPQHRGELLWQANALIRAFIAEEKIECVRKSFGMIPNDSVQQIIVQYGSKENLAYKEECSIKEYLCHQTYLGAVDSFNEWIHLFHNRPKEPQFNKQGASFTERIAFEHKEQAYQAEVERWRMNLADHTKMTRDLLYNVLLFPEKGWLIDPECTESTEEIENDAWRHRLVQLENLRKICIPDIVLLLHKVLHLSGEYRDCVKLADELASENRQLYTVYSSHKLAEFLSKIAESSLALLNEKSDPWGYSNN